MAQMASDNAFIYYDAPIAESEKFESRFDWRQWVGYKAFIRELHDR